jgi:hypothetical protein
MNIFLEMWQNRIYSPFHPCATPETMDDGVRSSAPKTGSSTSGISASLRQAAASALYNGKASDQRPSQESQEIERIEVPYEGIRNAPY